MATSGDYPTDPVGWRAVPSPAPPPPPPPPAPDPAPKKNRAGRNLPAAIGVGLALGAVIIASLFVYRPAFLLVVAVAVVIGSWEMTRAVSGVARPPLVPLAVGAVAMVGLAWFGGPEALVIGLLFTVAAVLVWRLADGPADYRRDVTAATLIAAYVPFLAGFAVLLARPDDGAGRILATLGVVVCSDTGGYVAGVLFGRHPMSPTVSPKKSWEGFAGSVLTCAVAGFLILFFAFHRVWWAGVIFGIALSLVSVLGDLGESLLKRDLGIKDISNLLPGHGGLMDRLDSILFAVPVAYALLTVLSPPTG